MVLKRFFILCFVIFFIQISAFSQLLDANQPLFKEDPFFNKKFIKTNQIKSIKGSWSSKKVKDIIRKKNVDFYYEFNREGMLTQQYSTFLTQQVKKDTSIIAYTYNKQNQIIVKRKTDNKGFFSLRYQYDNNGNLKKETYAREENGGASIKEFDLKREFIIKTDSFHVEQLSEKQEKTTFYNGYGKSYKEEFKYFDDLGFLVEVYTKFLIGNKKSKITLAYDELGRLSQRTTIENLNLPTEKKEVFLYDDVGNLIEIKAYENEDYKTSTQFLYDKNMLLTAQLTKEIVTEFITIIQYEYGFYE